MSGELTLVKYGGFVVKLSSAIELFLAEGGFKTETKRHYRVELGYLLSALKNPELCEITSLSIYQFLTELGKTKPPKRVYRIYKTIRSFLGFLELIDVECVKKNKIKMRSVPEDHWGMVEPEDYITALKLSHPYYKQIVVALYTTGLRIAELCSINVEDIDFQHNRIKILGKGSKPDYIYICPELKKVMIIPPSGKWISSTPNAVRAYFQRMRTKENITTLHPHAFRKSFATRAWKQTHDLRAVQALCRHSRVETTTNYTIVKDAELQDIHNRIFTKNHEIYCCKKEGGDIKWEIKGWVAAGGKSKAVERAINKAITDMLD